MQSFTQSFDWSKPQWLKPGPAPGSARQTPWKLTLLVGMLIILAGCQTMPTKPPKPMMVIIERSDGGICLDRADAVKLGRYIQDLEAGY